MKKIRLNVFLFPLRSNSKSNENGCLVYILNYFDSSLFFSSTLSKHFELIQAPSPIQFFSIIFNH